MKSFQKGIDVALNSNAVLLTEKLAKKFCPCLTWARFTIHPFSENKNSRYIERRFSKAVKNIKTAAEIKKT